MPEFAKKPLVEPPPMNSKMKPNANDIGVRYAMAPYAQMVDTTTRVRLSKNYSYNYNYNAESHLSKEPTLLRNMPWPHFWHPITISLDISLKFPQLL